MNALLLTEAQSEMLELVNEEQGGARAIRARRLADDRLIVNADVLADSSLAAWHAALAGAVVVVLGEAELAEAEGLDS